MALTQERAVIKRCYIDGPFGQIHIAETGSGRPILLIHQTPRSWDEFREVMQLLAGKFRLIAMDLPGMGCSDPVTDNATIEAYAEAAKAVVEWISDESLVVCGHHTGGVVAMELTVNNASLVSSLVLSSTPWVDASTREQRALSKPIDSIDRTANGSHLQSLWDMRSDYYPQGHEYLDRFIADAMQATDPVEGHIAVGQYEMESKVRQIKCPVLVVNHAKDPFASRHTESLMQALPQAELKVIDNGRVPLEATASEFAAVLESWCNKA